MSIVGRPGYEKKLTTTGFFKVRQNVDRDSRDDRNPECAQRDGDRENGKSVLECQECQSHERNRLGVSKNKIRKTSLLQNGNSLAVAKTF